MRWIERVIEAHKRDLLKRPDVRRETLIERWDKWRTGSELGDTIEKCLELLPNGSANERELAFYVLMDICAADSSLLPVLSQLTAHPSAEVRRELAFHLARELPQEVQTAICTQLLHDKSASVRSKMIERVGMCHWKFLLPDLRGLRSGEKNEKVAHVLDFWLPLLESGYRVEPSTVPGILTVTALTGEGIASKNVNATNTNDPAVLQAVEELKSVSKYHSTES